MITYIFTLIGVIIGHFLSYLSQGFLLRKQTSYKISEIIIEKRLQAYDILYEEIKNIKIMEQVDYDNITELNNKIIRYPKILKNYNTLADYYNNLLNVYNKYSQWYSNDLIKVFNFFQDYIMYCGRVMHNIPEESIINFALSLHKDILNIGSMFDKTILLFYTKECLKKFDELDSNLWHKFPISDTTKMLKDTDLFKNYINNSKNA